MLRVRGWSWGWGYGWLSGLGLGLGLGLAVRISPEVRLDVRLVPPPAKVHVLQVLARARGEDNLHAAAAQVDDAHGRYWGGTGVERIEQVVDRDPAVQALVSAAQQRRPLAPGRG